MFRFKDTEQVRYGTLNIISIHHMFRFKCEFSSTIKSINAISIHHMFRFKFVKRKAKSGSITNFNTSYVSVQAVVMDRQGGLEN